jgi:hypothetical protein
MFKIIENKHPKICCAYRCKNNKVNTDRFCSKHRKRWQKETNPESYFFNLLKSNAKRRQKDFQLTLEEFKQFCLETNYLELKGKTAKSASIDRIRSHEGYHINNIQVLSLSNNSKKMHDDKKNNQPDEEDCPF